MKKNVFKMMVLAALMASCSDDDSPITQIIESDAPAPPIEEATNASVVLNEVAYLNNWVEILNNGEEVVDLEGYFLCLGPGTYRQIGALETQGNVQLAPGEFLIVSYEMPTNSGGLGLYVDNSGFGDASTIADFVQWGEGGSARENVAVEAGLWNAGEAVAVLGDEENSIVFDGEGMSAAAWAESSVVTPGEANILQVAEVRTTIFDVTISNVSNYFAAHVFNTPVGASAPGRLLNIGDQYQISFQAVPGTRFTPTTMMFNSNDWFLAPTDLAGINLWENGQALNGVDIADQLSLYDSGTEADNDPANFPPAGLNVGAEDANNLVRLVEGRTTTASDYITAVLDYAPGNGSSAGTFTFTITALTAAAIPFGQDNGFGITAGIVVLHALPEPLFTLGEADRGFGLEEIAENGNPTRLNDWLTETGTNGSPLRLASSLSVFSPGLVYAFNSERDPLVLQGEENNPLNGLEELAEDGNNAVAVDFLANLGIPVAASNETVNQGPGQDLTFTIEVPQGEGYKFGFATMFVQTNDWFISYNNEGYPLFDENGNPVSGTGASEKSYLYDAGTEIDEAVGFGSFQPPTQSGPNQGGADGNTTVRRVSNLEDVQFGKGVYDNGPGVVYLGDPRGGYNVIRVEIQAR